MGEGFLPTAADGRIVAKHLRGMFSEKGLPTTRDTYDKLKSVYDDLLTYDNTATGNSRRKRSLRYAAWLMTSDIDFKDKTSPYPAKKFKAWLRWLTWVERFPPRKSVVTIDSALSKERPAEAIIRTLSDALQNKQVKSVDLEWAHAGDNDPELTITVTRRLPEYKISISSRSEKDLVQISDNEDDDL